MKLSPSGLFFKWKPAAKKLVTVTYTAKLNAGNSTDSLDIQSNKVWYKYSVLLSHDELTVVK